MPPFNFSDPSCPCCDEVGFSDPEECSICIAEGHDHDKLRDIMSGKALGRLLRKNQ